MRLVFLDSDWSYLKQIRSIVSGTSIHSSFASDFEFHAVQTIEQLEVIMQSQLGGSVLCVHENRLEETMAYFQTIPKETGQVLSLFVLIDDVVHPRLKSQIEDNPLFPGDYDQWIIKKFQPISELIPEIKARWLENCDLESIHQHRSASICAVFSPLVDQNQSLECINQIKCLNNEKNRLFILIDPYFGGYQDNLLQDYRQSVSYYLSLVKRGKNHSFLLDQMALSLSDKMSFLGGPMNMLDLECLNDKQIKSFIHFLKKKSGYEQIIISFCGVHINQFVRTILESSDERVLITQDERIQEVVARQLDIPWTIADRHGYKVLKEVVK